MNIQQAKAVLVRLANATEGDDAADLAEVVACMDKAEEALDQVQRAWCGDGISMAAAVDTCLLSLSCEEGGAR